MKTPTRMVETPGTRVYAFYRGPDKVGTVLERHDPRAWENTLKFVGTPTEEETRAHLAKLEERGDPMRKVPVAWDFGRTYWEDPDNLAAITAVAPW